MQAWWLSYASAWQKMTEYGYAFNGTSLVPRAAPQRRSWGGGLL